MPATGYSSCPEISTMDLGRFLSNLGRVSLRRIADGRCFRAWPISVTYKHLEIACPKADEIAKDDTFGLTLPGQSEEMFIATAVDVHVDSVLLALVPRVAKGSWEHGAMNCQTICRRPNLAHA